MDDGPGSNITMACLPGTLPEIDPSINKKQFDIRSHVMILHAHIQVLNRKYEEYEIKRKAYDDKSGPKGRPPAPK